jgi:Protein of unknown function (DUF2934)
MPYDITMCAGGDCPIKKLCYRHNAEIEGRQDFFGNIPFDFNKNTCDSFWKDAIVYEKIRSKAYQIWVANGRYFGNDLENWQKAEKEFMEEH